MQSFAIDKIPMKKFEIREQIRINNDQIEAYQSILREEFLKIAMIENFQDGGVKFSELNQDRLKIGMWLIEGVAYYGTLFGALTLAGHLDKKDRIADGVYFFVFCVGFIGGAFHLGINIAERTPGILYESFLEKRIEIELYALSFSFFLSLKFFEFGLLYSQF